MTETERRERNPNCTAIQYSDEMACARCRLVWDVNDPEPPKCLPIGEGTAPKAGKSRLRFLRRFDK